MTNLQLIESLCSLVEVESKLIQNLASRLIELDALTDKDRKSISILSNRYSDILGCDEAPDQFSDCQ